MAAGLAVLGLGAAPLSAQTPAQNDSAAAAARRANDLPLIPTRTLSFTTDEGTWISLDVHPDGSQLVFELLGDLYTLPTTGGTATRITEGAAYDMQPRYSPDGEQIVFVSDRDGSENVWIVDADGSDPIALTDGERESYLSPVWAPDEPYVVVGKGSQLWLYHTAGGSGVQITGHREEGGPAPASHSGAAFGGDPGSIWVNVRGSLGGGFDLPGVGGEGGDADSADPHPHAELGGPRSSAREVGAFQIGLLERATGSVRIRTHEMEGAFRPVASPDGRWLVYSTRFDARQALKLLDLETGEESWLRMDVQRDESQGGGTRDRDVMPGSAFTPDSEALITSWGGKIWRVAVPSGEATEIPFSADVEMELGPLARFDYPINDSTLVVSQVRGARPSPDGSQVVFSALAKLWIADLPAVGATPPGDAEAWVVENARRLTTDTDVEHAPVWSPDGRWIAWITWNDTAGGDIWRMPAAGGTPERLTPESAFYDKLAWSPDGSRLVAVRGSRLHRMRTLEDFGRHSGAAELEYVWLPADGGEPSRIAWVGAGATQEGRNAPHFGPDPDRIVVWTGSDGLVSMRFDGTDPRTVVKVTGPRSPGGGAGSPDEVVLSPDGTRALVRSNRHVFLITVPPVGGEVPTVSVGGSSVVPTRQMTVVGGDFVGWRSDAAVAHWSIGRSYFQADVAVLEAAVADSVATARAERAARATAGEGAAGDSAAAPGDAAAAAAESDEDDDDGPAYEPDRFDIEIVAEKDRPEGTVVFRGARIITMRDDEVIPNGDLVVTDNRITAVGPSGSLSWPDDAEVIDVSGKTIVPGLVDIHAHAWVAWGVHRDQVSQFMAQLAYGVTTQRDPQTSSSDVVTYSDRMELGELIGPRLYSTGPGIFSGEAISSLDEARDVVRRYSDHFNTKTIKQYLAGDRKVRQWVVMAAHELGLTPTTEGGSNFTMNLTLMQDGYAGLEHSLPISPFFDDVIELARFSGLTYTPTLIVAYGGPSGMNYYLTHTDVDTVARLKRFTPHDELDKWQDMQWYRDDQYVHPLHAAQLTKLVEAGGQGGAGITRRGAGARHPLGVVDDGEWGNGPARRASGGHDPLGRCNRTVGRHRFARGGKAGRSADSR